MSSKEEGMSEAKDREMIKRKRTDERMRSEIGAIGEGQVPGGWGPSLKNINEKRRTERITVTRRRPSAPSSSPSEGRSSKRSVENTPPSSTGQGAPAAALSSSLSPLSSEAPENVRISKEEKKKIEEEEEGSKKTRKNTEEEDSKPIIVSLRSTKTNLAGRESELQRASSTSSASLLSSPASST